MPGWRRRRAGRRRPRPLGRPCPTVAPAPLVALRPSALLPLPRSGRSGRPRTRRSRSLRAAPLLAGPRAGSTASGVLAPRRPPKPAARARSCSGSRPALRVRAGEGCSGGVRGRGRTRRCRPTWSASALGSSGRLCLRCLVSTLCLQLHAAERPPVRRRFAKQVTALSTPAPPCPAGWRVLRAGAGAVSGGAHSHRQRAAVAPAPHSGAVRPAPFRGLAGRPLRGGPRARQTARRARSPRAGRPGRRPARVVARRVSRRFGRDRVKKGGPGGVPSCGAPPNPPLQADPEGRTCGGSSGRRCFCSFVLPSVSPLGA